MVGTEKGSKVETTENWRRRRCRLVRTCYTRGPILSVDLESMKRKGDKNGKEEEKRGKEGGK